MQTFLPFKSFSKTAKVLDRQRLGKQRVEAFQILKANDLRRQGVKAAWQNHPAALMWYGYDDALKLYFNAISKEWISRGYKHNMGFYDVPNDVKFPGWIGNKRFHSSHRSALLFKKQDWYQQFDWSETPEYNYYWPVTKENKNEN